jgi:hypothetical protein
VITRGTLDRLGELMPSDQSDAAGNIFLGLARYRAGQRAPGRAITVPALRAELERRAVMLPADRRQAADLRGRQAARRARDDTRLIWDRPNGLLPE